MVGVTSTDDDSVYSEVGGVEVPRGVTSMAVIGEFLLGVEGASMNCDGEMTSAGTTTVGTNRTGVVTGAAGRALSLSSPARVGTTGAGGAAEATVGSAGASTDVSAGVSTGASTDAADAIEAGLAALVGSSTATSVTGISTDSDEASAESKEASSPDVSPGASSKAARGVSLVVSLCETSAVSSGVSCSATSAGVVSTVGVGGCATSGSGSACTGASTLASASASALAPTSASAPGSSTDSWMLSVSTCTRSFSSLTSGSSAETISMGLSSTMMMWSVALETRGVIASCGPSVEPDDERIDFRGWRTPATCGGRGVARFHGAAADVVRRRDPDGGVALVFKDVDRVRVPDGGV